ncbi:type I phosphomannose isomerase catalytic subunit [Flavobacterium sp. I3-2]|uniref:type I phosphomannose isomerase catalytic subunit n=1 Tax=Flavobacterium sp. I3-2 TaxID=2748319 RepID=UPI0021085137|nr:type I phosphomannose isomerase catalytic subunit [Flavobacterium sp. I3-2]
MNSNSNNINILDSKEVFIAYPLLFKPILKNRIWGGNKLATLGKELTSETTGESWELSMVENDLSVVANGLYTNETIKTLIDNFSVEILGDSITKRFGKQFPLLFKFLDAKSDLSIQLHPNDELAKKRHNSFGKTEMWYIMQADENARIILGFKENSSSEEYLEHLEKKSLPTILKEYKVKKGDVFFIETGTIHAIGGGILLAEIQQTSDITYRVYDWDRVDENGNSRELHVDLALEAINYQKQNPEIVHSKTENQENRLVSCDFFTTNLIPLNGALGINKSNELFYVYICTEGNFEIVYNSKTLKFKKGDTILIPAELKDYTLKGEATLLEIFIK